MSRIFRQNLLRSGGSSLMNALMIVWYTSGALVSRSLNVCAKSSQEILFSSARATSHEGARIW